MGNKYNLSASPPFQKVPPSMLVNSLSSRHEHTYSGANNLPLHQNWVIQSKESFSYPWKKIFSKKVRWPGAVEGACNWIVRVWRRFESNLKKVIIKTSSIPELWYDYKRKSPRGDIFSHPPRHFVRIGMPSWNQLLHCWWHRDLNYYSAMVWWTS